MKHLLLLIAVCVSSSLFAQQVSFSQLTPKQKEEYLIKLGRELTRTFGPGYYREKSKPVITRPKTFTNQDYTDNAPEIHKNLGRKYYTVTFPYDPTKETLEFNFASEARIWADTGEPLDIAFGNGYGINFLFLSYKEQTAKGAIIDTVPYQQAAQYPKLELNNLP